MLDTILSRLHPSECEAVITNAVTTTTTRNRRPSVRRVCFRFVSFFFVLLLETRGGERKLFSQVVNIKHPINLLRGWSCFLLLRIRGDRYVLALYSDDTCCFFNALLNLDLLDFLFPVTIIMMFGVQLEGAFHCFKSGHRRALMVFLEDQSVVEVTYNIFKIYFKN